MKMCDPWLIWEEYNEMIKEWISKLKEIQSLNMCYKTEDKVETILKELIKDMEDSLV